MKTNISPQSLLWPLCAALLLALLVLATGPRILHAQTPLDYSGPQTHLRGHIAQQDATTWVVNGATVVITPDTSIDTSRGAATNGAFVDLTGTISGETVIASRVIVLYPAGGNGPIVELSGIVSKIKESRGPDGKMTEFWMVGGQPVSSTQPETLLIGEPQVGWLVWVVGVSEAETVRALAIEGITDDVANEPVDFEGTLEEVADGYWRVAGKVVSLTNKSLVLGIPRVGVTAEVRAREAADGSLTGLVLRAVDPNSEAFLNAIVSQIVSAPDGSQTWDVTTFTGAGGELRAEEATIKITDLTYVEERRTALRPGVYAEIDGIRLNTGEVRAELVRLDRPTPVTLSGVVGAASASANGEFWTVGGRRVWSATPKVTQVFRSAERESGLRVTVRGVRLGNGLIWVQSAGASSGNMR